MCYHDDVMSRELGQLHQAVYEWINKQTEGNFDVCLENHSYLAGELNWVEVVRQN